MVVAGLVTATSKPQASPGAPAAASAGCATNRQCVQKSGGKPAICRREDGACVALASEDCRVLAEPGDVENDATLWLGAMFPERATDPASTGLRAANAVDLARRDFAKTTGGLLPVSPGGPKRPIGVVLCDDSVDANTRRAAAHLADVRVPALLGFARSREVLDLAPSLFLPNGVLVLTSNMASTLRDVPRAPGGERLVGRISTSVDAVVPALAALLAEVVEPELRGVAAGHAGADAGAPAPPALHTPTDPVRVTLIRASTTSGQGYGDLLVSTLRFNGKSVAENGERFREVVVEGGGADDAAWSARAADLVAHKPHVVIVAGASAALIPAVEKAWPAAEKLRPRYLVGAALGAPALQAFVQEHPDLRARIYGVSTEKRTAVLTKFVLHYNDAFSPKVTVEDAESAPYDGFYLLAYAAAALRAEPVTGAALARAIPRLLPPGEHIDVGHGGIYPALYALGAGKGIDLDGASTSLDFDLETGDAAADLAIDCLTPGHHGGAPHQVESGLFFRARTHKLEGVRRCP